jgi:hypothetical protein
MIVAVLVLLQLFLIGVSAWHFYRYVLAPKMGWVDPRSRFFELIRIAGSPYRPPQDRDKAISELKTNLPSYKQILSSEDISRGRDLLRTSLERYETPYSYRYELLNLIDLLEGRSSQEVFLPTNPVSTFTPPSPSTLKGDELKIKLVRLKELSEKRGEEFDRSRKERVQLLIEIRLKSPCAVELRPIVESLEMRTDLTPYERGIVLSSREALRRCP